MPKEKWKELENTREHLKYTLVKQFLDTIYKILPHSSQTTVLNSSLVPYQRAIFKYARDRSFNQALLVLLDIMDQIISESGWEIVSSNDATDNCGAGMKVGSRYNPTLVTESFTVLSNLLEYGWTVHILVSSGLDLTKAKSQSRYGSIMNIEQTIYEAIDAGVTEFPLFEEKLALRFYSTISRLLPPEIRNTSPHNFTHKDTKATLISQSILSAGLHRIFGVLILLHGSSTFRGCYQQAFKVHFTKGCQYPLNPSLRLEVLSCYYYNPENPMEMFETLQRLMLSQKSNTYTNDIAAVYGTAIMSWLIQGFAKLNYPSASMFKTFACQIADHVRGRFPIMDKKDTHYQMLMVKLAILSESHGKWWNESPKSIPKWLKYLRNNQARVSQKDGNVLSTEFCSHIAWFAAVYRDKGTNKEQSHALVAEMNTIYLPLHHCMAKLGHDLNTRSLMWMVEYHAAYAAINPEVYFEKQFTNLDKCVPINLMSSILGISNRLLSYDMGRENWVHGYSSYILHAITFAGNMSLLHGPNRACYIDTFVIGAVVVYRAGVYGIQFSSKSIRDFCSMMMKTSWQHSTKNRELAVNSIICLIRCSFVDSIDVIAETYDLLCDLLRPCEELINDIKYVHSETRAWNVHLVHDILVARAFITQKFLEIDPSKYHIDKKLERTLRTALTICICSTDKDMTVAAIECTKQLSKEISFWTKAQLPIDDFMKDSYHLCDFWALIINFAPRDVTKVTHRLSIQKISTLFFEKFTNPPITEWLLDLVKTGLGLWDILLNDTEGRLSTPTRGSLINLMILITGIAQCVRASTEVEHRELVRDLAMKIAQGLTSVHGLIRDSTTTTTRLALIQNPSYALGILEDVSVGWVLPKYKNVTKPKSMNIQEYRGISSLTSEVMSLYRVIGDSKVRAGYDVCQLATSLFAYCRYLYHNMPISLSEPLFRINIYLAGIPSLLCASKFDTFESVVNIIVQELHSHPDHKCLPLMAETLAILLDDFTLYSASNGSYSVFDKRYTSFKTLVTTLSPYLEPSEIVSTEVAKNIETAIIKLCISNQDLAITFEEAELVGDNNLRYCIYQCFTTILSEESDPNNQQQYDEIINLLLKDMVILEGMCEICPQEDARDFTAHVSTLFSEYGRVLELGMWAFERDLASAQTPDEVLRKNSINVWIVIQIFFTHLKPFYRQGVQSLIRKVYQNPYVFQKLTDPNSDQCYDAVVIGKELYRRCAEAPEKCFGTPILKLVKFIQDKSNERFPGSADIIFRNLLLLRVTCPMIVQPQNFGIMSHSPEGIVRDGLIQLVKFMQKIDFKNTGSRGVLFAAKELQYLRQAMVERSEIEGPGEFYNPMFSSEAINQSFYSIKQFFYRHSRELQAYLFIHAGESVTHNPMSKTISNGVQRDVRLLNGFSQLLHKLGRPNMGLLNRSDRHRSSHTNTRKNSSVTWNYVDDNIFEINKVGDLTYLIVNMGSAAWPATASEHVFRNDLANNLNKCADSRINHQVIGFADNTWGCLPVQMLILLRDQIVPASTQATVGFDKICHLNSSFAFFQAHIKTPFIVEDSNQGVNSFVTSLDFTPEKLEVVGVADGTILVVRDCMGAEKFENISLEYLGATHVFDIYVGAQYVHVISSYNSCDVFTFDSIRFINGAIHLKKHIKSFMIDYTVKAGDSGSSASFHKKLWNVLNTTRNNRNFFSPHPFMEVSAKQFQTFLLGHCLLDLGSDHEVARWHAHNLIPNILAKSPSHEVKLDVPLQTHSWQPQLVTEVSRSISKAYPELVFDILQSFITITSHSGRLTRIAVDIFEPWFDMIPVAVDLDTNHKSTQTQEGTSRLHRLTRSLFSLNDALFDSDPISAELLRTHMWPYLMNSSVSPQVVDVFMACNAFKIEVLKETESRLTEGIAISTKTLKYLYGVVFGFIQDNHHISSGIPRWSDNLAWCRIKVNLMTFAGCVFSGPDQILEMLPHIIVVLFTFSATGTLSLRKSMHRLMNNVINQCAMSPKFALSTQDQLRKLQSEINSNNGLLLFGVHTSTNDEEYDIFDGVPFADSAKLGTYLVDLCSTILPPREMAQLRSQILSELYCHLQIGNAAFYRRTYMGILTFTNSKMTLNEVLSHIKFFMSCILQLPSLPREFLPRYAPMLTQLYQIHCERILIWLDDSSIGRHIWSSLALLSMMVMPGVNDVTKILNTCIRICHLRGIRGADFTNMLTCTSYDMVKEWWMAHSDSLSPMPNPHKNFISSISYPLIALMRQVETRKTALEACESWLALYENDSTIDSTLELKMIYYIFAPDERLLTRANLFGLYGDGIDDERLLASRIEQKLAAQISDSPAHSIAALISVCQILDIEAVITPSMRFFNLIITLRDNDLVLHLEPILSPLCANLAHLLENDRPEIAIDVSEAVAFFESHRTNGYDESLAFVQSALEEVGRPKDVDDNFVLHPPKTHDLDSYINSNLVAVTAKLTKCIINPQEFLPDEFDQDVEMPAHLDCPELD